MGNYFLQNLLQKVFYTKYFAKKNGNNFLQIFFHNKIYKYFLQKKKFKSKLVENMSFFNLTNYWKQPSIQS